MAIGWTVVQETFYGVLVGTLSISTVNSITQDFVVKYVWRISRQGNVTGYWRIHVYSTV
jgi:hypothetical protein